MAQTTTQRLTADEDGIRRAATFLAAGCLVAFPTETVYGLGADARDADAVASIFEAKGRPRFNPLIVHVPDIQTAQNLGEIPAAAAVFIKDGWPGGLTLVVPCRNAAGIPHLVTAGQATIALRVPSGNIARRLLETFGGPIAAPSANISGRVSPTSAEHVLLGLDGRIKAVLDGGQTPAGLESTIIGFPDDRPVVLREGIYQVPDDLPRSTEADEKAGRSEAPGQLRSHYAPRASIRLHATTKRAAEWHLGFGEVSGDVSLSPSGDLREAAAQLFTLLHQADASDVTQLAIAPIPNHGLGRAINDRLNRAAAPRG